MATTAMLRRSRWASKMLGVWLGHAVCVGMLARPLLSILQAVYFFAYEIRSASGFVPSGVRREVSVFADLCFLASVDLGALFSTEVYCGDPSDTGCALMSTRATPFEIHSATAFRERWRFHDVLVPEVVLRFNAHGLDHMGGLLRLGGDPHRAGDDDDATFADPAPCGMHSAFVPAAARTTFASLVHSDLPAGR